jgi:hypothetical protein
MFDIRDKKKKDLNNLRRRIKSVQKGRKNKECAKKYKENNIKDILKILY